MFKGRRYRAVQLTRPSDERPQSFSTLGAQLEAHQPEYAFKQPHRLHGTPVPTPTGVDRFWDSQTDILLLTQECHLRSKTR